MGTPTKEPDKFWKSCSDFLNTLAKFRNAIAHWHPYVEIYEQEGTDRVYIKHVLNQPKLGKLYESLDDQSVLPFIEECHYGQPPLSGPHGMLV